MNSMKKRVVSLELALVMLLSLLTTTASAAPTATATPTPAPQNHGQGSDVLTVQSAATGKTDLQKPKLGVGINILPANSQAAVYFGRYPQNSKKADDMSPIKWKTTTKPIEKGANYKPYMDYLYSPNAITMISEKVLDATEWADHKKWSVFNKKWTIFNKKWLIPYSKSKLFMTERALEKKAFNTIETASISKATIFTSGGVVGPSSYGGSVSSQTTQGLIYSPYFVRLEASDIYNDTGFDVNAQATAYAVSKGLKNEKYGASYWFRKPVSGGFGNNKAYEAYTFMSHIAKRGDTRIVTYGSSKDQTLGVRPLTRLKGEAMILVSQVDQKANSVIVNEDIPSGTFPEYELTLLDSSRKFTADTTGRVIQGDNWIVPVTYQNAKTGANEYISYTLTDVKGNVMEYRRVKVSDTASGAFNVLIPLSVLPTGGKLNVFNEVITPGYYSDYASPMSVITIN